MYEDELDNNSVPWQGLFDKAFLTEEGYLLIPSTKDKETFVEVFSDFNVESMLRALFKNNEDKATVIDLHPGEKSLWEYYSLNKPDSMTVTEKKHKTQKEGNSMKNNLFDFTMHQIEDKNIASTLLGVAVKVDDSWRVYDKKKKEITDLGDVQLGDFPLWVIPAVKLAPGDIIIDDGKYCCVTGKSDRVHIVDISTGCAQNIVPVKNILGFSVYQKVVAVTDVLGMDANFGDLTDDKTMMLMAMMFGGQLGGGNSVQNLMPLLLLGDTFGGDTGIDNNKLLMLSMMNMNGACGDNAQQNNMMQLLMMKRLLDDTSEPKAD